jgi:hypothetical protein
VPNRVQVYDGESILVDKPRLIAGPLADFAPFGDGFNGGVSMGASNDPPPLLETETTVLTCYSPSQNVTVVSEVNDLGGRFEWMYHVTNDNFTMNGNIPGMGMFFTVFDQEIPDAGNVDTTMIGWTKNTSAPEGAYGVDWVGGEFLEHLVPSQTRDFWFTTDPRPIGHNAAVAADDEYAYLLYGDVLGPEEKVTVEI